MNCLKLAENIGKAFFCFLRTPLINSRNNNSIFASSGEEPVLYSLDPWFSIALIIIKF